MWRWRYVDDQYTEDPDFVFNRLQYRKASILITGDNFRGWFFEGTRRLGISDYVLRS